MLGHKLRDGVTVVRDYDADLPRSRRIAGELNQVWTNLIDNAVDAMDGAGTLRDRHPRATGTRRGRDRRHRPGHAADEVAARAFEAFFTTKDVGKGTGLGLDIARRIVVERHGGDHRHRRTTGRDGAPGPAPPLTDVHPAATPMRHRVGTPTTR